MKSTNIEKYCTEKCIKMAISMKFEWRKFFYFDWKLPKICVFLIKALTNCCQKWENHFRWKPHARHNFLLFSIKASISAQMLEVFIAPLLRKSQFSPFLIWFKIQDTGLKFFVFPKNFEIEFSTKKMNFCMFPEALRFDVMKSIFRWTFQV